MTVLRDFDSADFVCGTGGSLDLITADIRRRT